MIHYFNIYSEQALFRTSIYREVRLSTKVSISNFNKLSLLDYCTARAEYCSNYHSAQCTSCCALIKAATLVLEAGVCSLHSVFKAAFPFVTYHTLNANGRTKSNLVCSNLLSLNIRILRSFHRY